MNSERDITQAELPEGVLASENAVKVSSGMGTQSNYQAVDGKDIKLF